VSASAHVLVAASQLGNGSRVIAQDTVPFALWCAARSLACYEDAVFTAVSAGGDLDTLAAIVGGIVVLRVGRAGLPEGWLATREKLRFVELA
jgi:ADP-ribosylglycohydrolase